MITKEQIAEAIEGGRTLTDLAREIGCSVSLLSIRAREHGIKVPPGHKPVTFKQLADKEWLEARVNEGLSDREIARLIGSTHTYVQKWRREFHIRKRKQDYILSGVNHPSWKEGRRKHGEYIDLYAPDHPFARKNYVKEHRLVAEQVLGRYLLPTEVVHHKNGIKTDNRPENLVVYSSMSEHIKDHPGLKKGEKRPRCPTCYRLWPQTKQIIDLEALTT